MIKSFSEQFPEVKVKIITTDALYCTGNFMGKSHQYYPRAQDVTQLRKTNPFHVKMESGYH